MRWGVGQVFLDGIVDVIPFGILVKVLDAGFLNLDIGYTAILPHQPFHGLLALRSVLIVLPQQELHPMQQGAGR